MGKYDYVKQIEEQYGEDAIFCSQCKYSLVNLEENICPKCKKPFDPKDYATYFKAKDITQADIHWVPLAAFVINLAILILILSSDESINYTVGLILSPVGIALGFVSKKLNLCDNRYAVISIWLSSIIMTCCALSCICDAFYV
ncbi:hypothetical protein JD969_09535 [Planctomycetota bacterium]|nr:hypothetical protein JD969_09535 [Planctomycetota bacterium]